MLRNDVFKARGSSFQNLNSCTIGCVKVSNIAVNNCWLNHTSTLGDLGRCPFETRKFTDFEEGPTQATNPRYCAERCHQQLKSNAKRHCVLYCWHIWHLAHLGHSVVSLRICDVLVPKRNWPPHWDTCTALEKGVKKCRMQMSLCSRWVSLCQHIFIVWSSLLGFHQYVMNSNAADLDYSTKELLLYKRNKVLI